MSDTKTNEFKELRTYLKPVMVRIMCPCGGEFKFTPEKVDLMGVLLTPDLSTDCYPHLCTKCGKVINAAKEYPHIDYEADLLGGLRL